MVITKTWCQNLHTCCEPVRCPASERILEIVEAEVYQTRLWADDYTGVVMAAVTIAFSWTRVSHGQDWSIVINEVTNSAINSSQPATDHHQPAPSSDSRHINHHYTTILHRHSRHESSIKSHPLSTLLSDQNFSTSMNHYHPFTIINVSINHYYPLNQPTLINNPIISIPGALAYINR